MTNAKVRVMLASERPESQQLLTELVDKEPRAVVVGRSENALKAVALANSLRPEVVMIDSQLPHVMGLDGVRLSRIGGLDTAMSILEQLSGVEVILLGNLDMAVSQVRGASETYGLSLYSETVGCSIPVRWGGLIHETPGASALVFANVQARELLSTRRKVSEISEKAMLYSGLAILGGLGLMLTIILAGAGAMLALAGVGMLLISLMVRMAAALWPKSQSVDRGRSRIEVRKPKEVRDGSEADSQRMLSL